MVEDLGIDPPPLAPGRNNDGLYWRVVSKFDLPPLQLQGDSHCEAVPRVETLGCVYRQFGGDRGKRTQAGSLCYIGFPDC